MPRLLSRLFAASAVLGAILGVATITPAAAAPSNFHIEGGGFGHGVGASQYGMLGYAQQGWVANDILTHYYSGTAIQALGQPSEVRVWLAEDSSAPIQTTLTPTGPVNIVVNGQVATTAASGEAIRVDVVNGKFNVFVANQQRLDQVGGGGTNVYVQYNQSPISLDKTGHQYKWGQLELSAVSGNSLRIVLTSETMQQYLYGLGEVPSSWPAEALKAQAIAARTYALEKINRLGQNRAECGCALWHDVRDQNYIGYDKESGSGGANWVNAVNATDGQAVTYQGAAIQAFYSSSSGGYTENSENVFTQALPYLKGVPDPYDAANGLNSLHSWKRDWSLADMQKWVNSNAATAVGTLESIEFLPPLGVSGRVTKVVDATHGGVRITGSDGTKRVNGTTFQSVINAAPGSGNNPLPSTLMRFGGASPYGTFTGGVFVAAGKLTSSDTNRIVTGADKGGGPHVRVLDKNGDSTNVELMAYDPKFSGGVRVAVCHFGEDALDSIVTAPGAGGGPHVRVFNAAGVAAGGGFMAYDPSFTGGLYVGCGDVDPTNPGDEIITGPGAGGGPHVKVFDRDGNVRGQFMAYDPKFTGGVRVAGGPGFVVTAPGPGGGPHVRLFNLVGAEMGGFMAYASNFTGGVYVAAGNVFGDGGPEVITGAGDAGGPHVRVFATGGNELTGFMAFQTSSDHGARVAAAHVPGGAVVAGSGTGGPSLLRVIPLS
jgi:SpoIID/LytB domain protein